MWRIARRHKQDSIEAKPGRGFPGDGEMSEVNGIERTAKDREFQRSNYATVATRVRCGLLQGSTKTVREVLAGLGPEHAALHGHRIIQFVHEPQ